MTRGVFVIEEGNQVIKAAELFGDAYLQNGYGEKILEAYKNGKEKAYLDSIYERMNSKQKKELLHIRPSWYRKTGNYTTERAFSEYGYAIRNDKLHVYHYGIILFSVDRKTAVQWLAIIQNLSRYEKTYLYDEEKMEMRYDREKKMFTMLQERIQQGSTVAELERGLQPADFKPVILEDMHCMDVWYRDGQPAYVKKLRTGCDVVKFIAFKRYGKWEISLQLPYIRVSILGGYSSEKKAMDELRKFIRVHLEEIVRFAEISMYVSTRLEAIKKETEYRPEVQRKILEGFYHSKPWFCAGRYFTVEEIMREFNNVRERCIRKQDTAN